MENLSLCASGSPLFDINVWFYRIRLRTQKQNSEVNRNIFNHFDTYSKNRNILKNTAQMRTRAKTEQRL